MYGVWHASAAGRASPRRLPRRRSNGATRCWLLPYPLLRAAACGTEARTQWCWRSRRALEEVAALLWEVQAPQRLAIKRAATGRRRAASFGELSRAFLELARRVSEDPPAHGRTLAVLQGEAAEVLATLADAMLGSGGGSALHQRLAKSWGRAEAGDLVRRALVLLADHELNASTFATRVTVSTGASLAAGVLSGLATLTGPLHGGAAAGVRELMEAAASQGADSAVRDRLAQARPMAGFGHPLYPAGDPRAAALLRVLGVPPALAQVRDVVEELVGERPNIDFALAVMTQTCRLPRQAPLVLFALARSVGWLAHALEQVTTGRLIRPVPAMSDPLRVCDKFRGTEIGSREGGQVEHPPTKLIIILSRE